MRFRRSLLACSILACVAVPMASPASAQEEPCPNILYWDGVLSYVSTSPDRYVQIDGSLTIRGDLVAADAIAALGFLSSSTATFVSCQGEWAVGLVTPYVECVLRESAPLLTSPDLVARYVHVGTDLVVQVHYAQALEDGVAIANCNGIVTSGG